MAASAEVVEGLAREVGLFDGDGLDHDTDVAEQGVALLGHLGLELTLHHNRELDEGHGRDTAEVSATHGFGIDLEAWFASRHGDDGRGVQDHLGSPFSS